jgi:hypothetical protein
MRESLVKKTRFDFASVSDTPFSVRDFSLFLNMSGFKLNPAFNANVKKNPPGTPKFILDTESVWRKELTPKQLGILQSNIKIAPVQYNNHWVDHKELGKKVPITSKIHHKMLTTYIGNRDAVTITGSYNFSDAAGANQEYIAIIKDEEFGSFARAIYNGLNQKSNLTVKKEVERRNKKLQDEAPVPEDAENAGAEQKPIVTTTPNVIAPAPIPISTNSVSPLKNAN